MIANNGELKMLRFYFDPTTRKLLSLNSVPQTATGYECTLCKQAVQHVCCSYLATQLCAPAAHWETCFTHARKRTYVRLDLTSCHIIVIIIIACISRHQSRHVFYSQETNTHNYNNNNNIYICISSSSTSSSSELAARDLVQR